MLSKELGKIWNVVDVGNCLVQGLRRMDERRKQRAQASAEPASFQEELHEALAQQGIEVPDIERLALELTGKAGVSGALRGVATSARVVSRVAERIEQGQEDTLAVMQRSLDAIGRMAGGRVVVRPTGEFRPEYAERAPTASRQETPRPAANAVPPPTVTDASTRKRSELAAHKRAMFLALRARVLAFEAELAQREAVLARELDAVAGRLRAVETRLERLELRAADRTEPEATLEDLLAQTAVHEASRDASAPVPHAVPEAANQVGEELDSIPSPEEPTETDEGTSVESKTKEPPPPDILDGEGRARPGEIHDEDLDELDLVLTDIPLEALHELEQTFEAHRRRQEDLLAEAEATLAINQGRAERAEVRLAVLEDARVGVDHVRG